jgi:hypothetical protein
LPYGRAAAAWLGILVIANVNGALREFLLVPLLGATVAHAISTILLCLLVLILARATIGWMGPRSAGEAWRVGLLWLALTLAFEFLAGHYLFGNSWERLLSEYNLAAGRIWSIVPLVTLLAPRWAWGRSTAGSGVASSVLLLVLGLGGGACTREPAADPAGGPAASGSRHEAERWAIRLDGSGPISYGMPVEQAEAAAGASTTARPSGDACAFVRIGDMPDGMQLMIERGRVVRADVTAGRHPTDRGAALGMSEAEVQELYGGALEVRPHKYDSAGRYLVLVPDAAADSLRIVFETDGSVVTRYRAGVLPAVDYVEGCG